MLLRNNNKSKLILIILSLSFVGLLLSQSIIYPEFKQVKSFHLNSISNGVLNTSIMISVENRNWFSYKSNDINAEIFYNKKLIAIGGSDTLSIKRKSNQNITLNTDLFLDSLHNDLYDILDSDSIELDIKITGKFSFLKIKKTVNLKTNISSDDLVQVLINDFMEKNGVEIKELKFNSTNMKTTSFDMTLLFKNKFPFDIKLNKLNLVVFSGKNKQIKLADWQSSIEKLIRINSFEEINGIIQLNNLNATLSGILKIMTGEYDYHCEGFSEVDLKGYKIKVPFKFNFLFNPISKEITIVN